MCVVVVQRECAAPCHTLWLLRWEFWFVTWFTRRMNMCVGAVRGRVCGALSHNMVRYLIHMTREYVCWGSWSGLYERVCSALSHNTAPSLRVLVCCLIHMTDACIYMCVYIYICMLFSHSYVWHDSLVGQNVRLFAASAGVFLDSNDSWKRVLG